jgi:hypothetical protein
MLKPECILGERWSYLLVVLVAQAGEYEREQRFVGEAHVAAAAARARVGARAAAHATLTASATARRPARSLSCTFLPLSH